MKAIVQHKYGTTNDLNLLEVEKPHLKDGEVLVKIHNSSVNSWDVDLVRGKPKIYRLMFGLFKPKKPIIGIDIAGTVESIGKNVSYFKPGDEVFGDISSIGYGAFAEFVCVPEQLLALKPSSLSFEEAAAIPHTGVLALQGIDMQKLLPGHKILLNGAGGGVGTFALQLAKMKDIEVTCVDKKEKLEKLKSLGADHIIDYQNEDFTRSGNTYDLILDPVANKSPKDYKRALNSDGRFVMIGGAVSLIFKILTSVRTGKSKKKLSILAHEPNRNDLDMLAKYYKEGHLKPVIDNKYSLAEVPQAIQRLLEGNVIGKIIISNLD